MRIAADLTSRTLGMLAVEVREGVTPLHLDKLAHDFICDHGAQPGFLGLYGFPNTLCISCEDQVVHGIPTKNPLAAGTLVSIDCGVVKDGFCGDQAYTFSVGELSKEKESLLRVTQQALLAGIKAIHPGGRIGDIGYAIGEVSRDYGVVRELVGHGIGRKMHEGPDVPNYGRRGQGRRLVDGMVLAIEPMINLGTSQIVYDKDQWTVRTADGLPSAHYEHNVAIIGGRPEVLTTFSYIEEAQQDSLVGAEKKIKKLEA